MGMTYAKAGVDIDGKSSAISQLVRTLAFRRKGRGRMLDLDGHFTGLIDFGEHALSLCTDTVGTKIVVANEMKRWDTIGIDCMAMNVNDMICIGAEPLAFVDFISIDRPDPERARQIGVGLNEGARMSNVSIIGGEIAVVPDIVSGTDLGGTCLGSVLKKDIITGAKISAGDSIIGVGASGIHCNGLTLARKIIEKAGSGYRQKEPKLGRTWGDELLEPTEIYVRGVMAAVAKHGIHGMANITGGGLRNLIRLKKGLEYRFDEPLAPNRVFSALQELGKVDDREMYQTFNMGMGYAFVAPEREAKGIIQTMKKAGHRAKVVGTVAKSKVTKATLPELGLSYDKY
ncbi:MAG: phosphoribosylformylglycinamidine cyclo-ligase [Methanobacteriota archaeon]